MQKEARTLKGWHRYVKAGTAWLVTLALLGSMLLSSAMIPASAATRGDVNGDGSINVLDAILLYNSVAGSESLTEEQAADGDVNGDGTANVLDAIIIYQYVSGTGTLPELPEDDPVEQPAATLTALDPADYYGRTLLAQESDAYVQVYDYIGRKFVAMETAIDLEAFGLTVSEFEKIFNYYHDDHPEIFWVNPAYQYWYTPDEYYDDGTYSAQGTISSIVQEYLYTAEEVTAYQQQLETRAAELLEGITDAMPVADRERLVHDRLILSSDYDMTHAAANTHDLIGVMLNGTGVCESYSRAFQYLMYRCGIQTILVIGQSKDGEAHMWNAIQLDGDWYQLDVTWDDPVFQTSNPDYVGYEYYNITTAYLNQTHDIYMEYSGIDPSFAISYPIPDCTATAENLGVKSSTALASFDTDVMAPVFADSILHNTQAMFRPVDGYTIDQFHTDLADEENFWALIAAINERLSAEEQLTRPGYSIDTNETYGFVSVYLRQIHA